ncbi:hypothetical protein BY458DRAFT_511105 [Sporodiniella umbellata]|nr:hypothetical protein BY458DRAFT_511105 [Sporodiniella umbellata]
MDKTSAKNYGCSKEGESGLYGLPDILQSGSPNYSRHNIDFEDAKSVASASSLPEKIQPMAQSVTQPVIQVNHVSKITHSMRLSPEETPTGRHKGSLREKRDPERRNVHRRSSLLPKSKALLRVIDQADEDTRLSDLEMRREKDLQLKIADITQDVPAASWTQVLEFPYYQSSRLKPEIEASNMQLDSQVLSTHQTYRAIKRKVSEDRFEPYPTFTLKRRAVSPSVSLSGSPILTGMSSPPISFAPCPSTSPHTSARHKYIDNNTFTLQDASGGISRMSLSD